MKYLLSGLLLITASYFLIRTWPASEFIHLEVKNLNSLYTHPKSIIKELANHYPVSDVAEATLWLNQYQPPNDSSISYLFHVAQLLKKFEQGTMQVSPSYKGRVFQSILDSKQNSLVTDCGQYTDFISLFMYVKGLSFRRIDAHYIPDTAIGAHSFQEIYIPEKDEWAYVDITNDKILMQHSNGHLVNTLDMMERIAHKDYKDINIYSYKMKNVVALPWNQNRKEEHKCFDPSIMLLYYKTNDVNEAYHGYMLIRRHFLFYDWVVTYNSPIAQSNLPYYLRLGILFLGILFLITGFVTLTRKYLRQKT